MALLARTGRHRQRYQDGFRLVSGCIPYRLKKNVDDHTGGLEDRLEVLMISSPNRHDLVFPKGGWEDDETVFAAACREALEEAGVRGNLDENPLGEWKFRSKSRQNSSSLEGGCWGYMFALEVVEELESWPEQANHERKWLTVMEASELCRYEWMRIALEECRQRVLQDNEHQTGDDTAIISAPAPVSEVAGHQISLPSYFVKSSGTQHLENPINALC
ncbi:nudix hydrolase 13, mitochondrial-like [Tasmannia lanceolata]|uniref:nudix hydrolase 13, mitochondrial-like n=1 Tax=Tasmannia lanceolata TaxID=3420 RepID=UPI004063776E